MVNQLIIKIFKSWGFKKATRIPTFKYCSLTLSHIWTSHLFSQGKLLATETSDFKNKRKLYSTLGTSFYYLRQCTVYLFKKLNIPLFTHLFYMVIY